MLSNLSRFLIAPALALIVAGCATTPQDGTDGTAEPTAEDFDVVLTRVPEQDVVAGLPTTVSWSVERDLLASDTATIQTNHTSVHFGPQSVGNPTTPDDYPQTGTVFCQQVPCTVPDDFNSPLTITIPGTYYIRAHAIIDGEHVWSSEEQFTVTAATGEQIPPPAGQQNQQQTTPQPQSEVPTV